MTKSKGNKPINKKTATKSKGKKVKPDRKWKNQESATVIPDYIGKMTGIIITLIKY